MIISQAQKQKVYPVHVPHFQPCPGVPLCILQYLCVWYNSCSSIHSTKTLILQIPQDTFSELHSLRSMKNPNLTKQTIPQKYFKLCQFFQKNIHRNTFFKYRFFVEGITAKIRCWPVPLSLFVLYTSLIQSPRMALTQGRHCQKAFSAKSILSKGFGSIVPWLTQN